MTYAGVIFATSVAQATWTAAGFSIPLVPCQREWNEYTASQVGKWRGLWTTYDPTGIQQGEADRMDTTLELSPDGTTLKHANTLYVGSVDSECSACFDSVETKDIPVGQYTKDTFRQRVSGGVYLSGPGVTRRGDMTTEVGFRDADRRVRCIISHRPQFNGPEPPSQLTLERIVLVRETLSTREGISPWAQSLSSQFDQPSWLGLWGGRTRVLESSAEVGGRENAATWTEENVSPTSLGAFQFSGGTKHELQTSSLEFDGGIRLEAPSVVRAGEPAEIAISWGIGGSTATTPSHIMHTNVRLEALSRIVDSESEAGGVPTVRISPPKLLRFAVGHLDPVESAG